MTDQEILGAAMAYTDKHGGGGGGGTTNYNELSNKPQIAGTTLSGNKSLADLGIASATALANKVDKAAGKDLSSNDYSDTEKQKNADNATAISAIKDGATIDSFADVESALSNKQDTLTFDDVPTANSNNPVKSGGVKSAIDAAVSSAYHHAGTKTCVELVAGLLVAANEGNVYNMTDSGTTTADFIEGAGQPIKAGDNVGIAKISDGVYKFDLLSGFVDTSNFVQKSVTAGLLKNDGTVNDEIEDDVDTLTDDVSDIKSKIDDATVYPYADVITIPDAVPANLADCNVKIEPVQDLHGQSAPYVGGAGKALFPIKEITQNTSGVDVTTIKDDAGNILGYNLNGTATGNIDIWLKNSDIMTEKLPAGVSRYFYTGLTSEIEKFQFVVSPGYFAVKTTKVDDSEVQNMYINITSGCVLNNVKVYPMICLNSETDKSFAPYTNICPISGHTEVDVQRDGKNLFPGVVQYANSNMTDEGKINNGNQPNYDLYAVHLKDGNYAISMTETYESGSTVRVMAFSNTSYVQSDSTLLLKKSINSAGASSGTFTVDGKNFLLIQLRKSIENTQLELGQTTTPYVPYAGKTYTIALGDTIYGGTVDFDSGVMTVTHKCVDLGDYTYTKLESNFYTTSINDFKYSGDTSTKYATYCISDKYKCNISGQVPKINLYYNSDYSGHRCFVSNDPNVANMDATEFRTYITGTHICYELATPFTVQLNPQQIQLLKGTNTLTASTGQISVTANGVSGAIGSLQTQANDTNATVAELAEQLPTAPTTDGAYVLTVTVADGTPTYSWESTE